MLDSYIKNTGSTKTIIHKNNRNHVNEIKWDAEYDGDLANVSINMNNNGEKDKYLIQLDNDDLQNLLNIPSVNQPIEKRLLYDFKPRKKQPMILEMDDFKQIEFPSSLQDDLIFPLTMTRKKTRKRLNRRPRRYAPSRKSSRRYKKYKIRTF
jgi:hypothetical protein